MTTTDASTVEESQRPEARDWVRRLTRRVKSPLYALAHAAARSYIAGSELDDAIRVAQRLDQHGVAATIGYWDGPHDSPAGVMEVYQAAIDALAVDRVDAYLSIKLPSLQYSHQRLAELAKMARQHSVGLHFDALGSETVDLTWAAIERLGDGAGLGCTLSSRWRRSPTDADWAVKQGLAVRVVKGQWPDPDEPRHDPRAGYLEVVRRLAGRARRVAVASHDLETARQALEMLLATRTPVTLELLYGLPSRRQTELAREMGVPVRVYVPYGAAYLPYCLAQIKRNPRIAWWLLRDALRRA